MTQLRGRRVDQHGRVIFEESALLRLIYGDHEIGGLRAEPVEDVLAYNVNAARFGLPLLEVDDPVAPAEDRSQRWLIPDEYLRLDIKSHVLALCERPDETVRAEMELAMYEERRLLDLLRALHYLVTTMRKARIVWGVGRGSSVASYVLFLLGVHKIDSIRFELDVNVFLKPAITES